MFCIELTFLQLPYVLFELLLHCLMEWESIVIVYILSPPAGENSTGQAFRRSQVLAEVAELAWDFATKEGFRIFNAMPRASPSLATSVWPPHGVLWIRAACLECDIAGQ